MIVKINSGEDLGRLAGAYVKAGGTFDSTSMFFMCFMGNAQDAQYPLYVKIDPKIEQEHTLEIVDDYSANLPSRDVETAIKYFEVCTVLGLRDTEPKTVAVRFETPEDLTNTVELLERLGGRCPVFKWPDADSFPCSFKFPKKIEVGRLYTIYNTTMRETIEPEELRETWTTTEVQSENAVPKFEVKPLVW